MTQNSKHGESCDSPKAKPHVFNADFLIVAMAAVSVHVYFMVYTVVFLG